ncbi:MAG: hypothetical protein GXO14_03480 [Thermococci archaeon]|nr:hypothetical protein [Thermococci archaeon]
MPAPFPPVRREPLSGGRVLRTEDASKAVDLVRDALRFFRAGEPIVHRGPLVHADVPVLYLDFAIDRVHYDPRTGAPSPKGNPVHVRIEGDLRPDEIIESVEKALKEARVIDACEFRGPEDCWVVPVAWKSFIIMHVRVSADGSELIPDYGLTEEVRRHGV